MVAIDDTAIPTGELLAVDGTPFDFRSFRSVGERIDADHPQLSNGIGYDHTFVFRDEVSHAGAVGAALHDPTSGRYLEVLTSEPGV